MDKDEAVKKLNKLIQLDVDAAHAYDQSVSNMEDEPELIKKMKSFKDDHLRHIDELSREVNNLGGIPQEYSKDFKGHLIEGFTSLRSSFGTDSALKAMEQNEKMTNKKYDEALDWDIPATAKEVIQKGAEDEKMHLQFIRDTLSVRKSKK